jgi:hypothetical protein
LPVQPSKQAVLKPVGATLVAPTGLRKSWFFIFQCMGTGYQPAHLKCRIVKPCRYQLRANAEEAKSPPSRIYRGTFSLRMVYWLGWIIRPSLSIQIIGYDNNYEISLFLLLTLFSFQMNLFFIFLNSVR